MNFVVSNELESVRVYFSVEELSSVEKDFTWFYLEKVDDERLADLIKLAKCDAIAKLSKRDMPGVSWAVMARSANVEEA